MTTEKTTENKSEHKTAKKELSFEAQTAHFIASAARPFLYTVLVALVAAGSYLGYRHYQTTLESKSQEELFSLQKNVEDKEKKINSDAQEKVEAGKENKKADKKPAAKVEVEKTPQSLVATFSDDLKHYDEFIRTNANKKAAYMAAIQSARLASDYKDYARAESTLRQVVNAPEKTDLFAGLLRAQLSTVLIEQKKCTEALAELNQITDNKAQSYFHPQALLRMGACYIENKDWDKAQSALTRVEKDFSNTQAAGDAKQLKRLLLLKRGSPAGAKS